MDVLLRFDSVQRAFEGRAVLADFSLQVRRGEVVALLGRNGSGKTTAIRIGLGLLHADSGSSEIVGRPSAKFAANADDSVGVVAAFHAHYSTLRAGDAIDFEAGTRTGFDREFARRALDSLGLDAKRRLRELSVGERMQLSLALAVAQRPKLLILDEPTAGLDVVVRQQFLGALIDLVSAGETGILYATHHLADVERVADRIALLQDGRCAVDVELEALRGRAQRWRVRLRSGVRDLPALTGLAARRDKDGTTELTLLNVSAAELDALRSAAELLDEPRDLSLEELVVDIVGVRGAQFPSLHEEEVVR